MRLSEKLRRDHEGGDFGRALEGYVEQAEAMESHLDHLTRTNEALVDTIAAMRWRMEPRRDLREICVALPDPQNPEHYFVVSGLPAGLEAFKTYTAPTKG